MVSTKEKVSYDTFGSPNILWFEVVLSNMKTEVGNDAIQDTIDATYEYHYLKSSESVFYV